MSRRITSLLFTVVFVTALFAGPALRGEPVIPSASMSIGDEQEYGETDRVLRAGPDSSTFGSPTIRETRAGAPSPSLPPARESAMRRGADMLDSRKHSDMGPSPASSKSFSAASKRPQVQAKRRTVAATSVASNIGSTGRLLRGEMSWYCLPGRSTCTVNVPTDCVCAAAGPRLRTALGDWRGRVVTVTVNGASARTRLVDFCACPSRLLDGYAALWGGLGLSLSAGVVDVTVTW